MITCQTYQPVLADKLDIIQDGFKTTNAWVGNGINWLDDIQQFYRERSLIEKEYSAKLAALA
jgi:hypothetical protein